MRAELLAASAALVLAVHAPAAATDEDKHSRDQDTTPSLELLEFLGDWGNAKGQWLDPMALKQVKLPGQEQIDHDDKK